MKGKVFWLFLIFAFAVTFFANAASGQTIKVEPKLDNNPKVRMERTVGLIDLRDKDAVQRHAEQIKEGGFGPGDTPLCLLYASREFARPGDVVEFSMIPMVSSLESYSISGLRLRPGLNGEYDGTIPPSYFNADAGDYGTVTGLRPAQFLKVLTVRFNTDENLGKHQFSFAIWDSAGTLVQQIWITINLTNTGEYGNPYFIDSVRVGRQGLVNLTGRFPIGIPIYYFIGVPNYAYAITGPDPQYALYSTRNGTFLNGLGNMTFNRTTAIDVALWSPYTRQAVISTPAMIQRAEQ